MINLALMCSGFRYRTTESYTSKRNEISLKIPQVNKQKLHGEEEESEVEALPTEAISRIT